MEPIFSSAGDKTIRIWDITTGMCEETGGGYFDPVTSVTLSKDGTKIVSGSWNNVLHIWNMTTGMCEKTLRQHIVSLLNHCQVITPNTNSNTHIKMLWSFCWDIINFEQI